MYNPNSLRSNPIALFCVHAGLAFSALTMAAVYADESKPPTPSAMEAGMDPSVLPGDDFYSYVNGSWNKAAVIPNDKSAVGNTATMRDESDAAVQKLIEQATHAREGTQERKVGDYYAAYLNIDEIDKRGLAPIMPQLESIANIKNKVQLAMYFGAHLRADVDPLNATNFFTENLFGLWVAQDFHDHKRYTAYLLQGGLGLPDREYYLSTSPKMVNIRAAYLAHIAAILKLADTPDADAAAQRIVDLETSIAKGHATRADSADMEKADNTWKRLEFFSNAPGLKWDPFLNAAGMNRVGLFTVWHPSAIKNTSALVASVPLETWKEYLRFHALNQHTSVLPQAFFDQKFKLNSVLTGAKAPLPRWKYAVNATNAALGEEVGRLYVEDHFSPEAKARIKTMVANLLTAFKERVSNISWMAPSTKQEALAKISSFYVGVGYPDRWKDYTGLRVEPDDALGNFDRASEFAYQRAIGKFGKPVDSTEWCMTPNRKCGEYAVAKCNQFPGSLSANSQL